MRCFAALELPSPVLNHLIKVSGPLRDRYDIRWVARDQLHMTLMFAGELPDENVDALLDVIDEIELPPISLRLDAFGAFPPKGMPRVVWAGFGGEIEPLTALQQGLAERAEPLGIAPEKRGFTPHVTLGRVQGQFGLLALIDQMGELSEELNPKPFSPTALTLYQSILTPRGPVYEVMLRRRFSQ